MAQLRTGKPDHLLLKKGDTFTGTLEAVIGNGFPYSGKSATEPMLVSSYGSGARPIIQTANADTAINIAGNGSGDSLAFIGLDLYSYQRDPGNGSYVGNDNIGLNTVGIGSLRNFTWMLIEDCRIRFYGFNIDVAPGDNSTTGANLRVRRNVILDAYDNFDAGPHAVGIYTAGINGLLLEENVFDHNGWNATNTHGYPNLLSRNVYLQFTNSNVTSIGNTNSTSATEGSQFRSGATVSNDLYILDPTGFEVGHTGNSAPAITTANISNVVVTESTDMQDTGATPRGEGFSITNASGSGVVVSNNIVTTGSSTSVNAFWISIDSNANGVVASNNIGFNWHLDINDAGTGNTKTGDVYCATNLASCVPTKTTTDYPAATRTVGSYAGTVGLTATTAAFITASRAQSKDSWRTDLMAKSVNPYIRAGFGQ